MEFSKEGDVTPQPSYVFFVFEIKTAWTLHAKVGEALLLQVPP